MNVLFVHNNFPAQFRDLAADLVDGGRHSIAAIGSETAREVRGVSLERYVFNGAASRDTHPFARRFDIDCRRAEQVLYAAARLSSRGFVPDLVLVHCGWGESLPIRSVFPKARIAIYCEFYYRPEGLDVGFDPEDPALGLDGLVALHAKNAATLLALADADLGLSPTEWQRSTYPPLWQNMIHVGHEGVDTDSIGPNADARFSLPSGRTLTTSDEVLTYVGRDLEPLRGFRSFMRALPGIQRARPRAETIIIGRDAVSYGAPPPDGRTWKDHLIEEVGHRLDMSRVHFVGRLSFEAYISALQVSSAHVYFTYPFVLSWSFLEAMAVGCRIVASDTQPVREVMDERSGVLVPFFETDALVEGVRSLLSEPAAYTDMGRRARAVVQRRYGKAACVERLKDLLGLNVQTGGPRTQSLHLV